MATTWPGLAKQQPNNARGGANGTGHGVQQKQMNIIKTTTFYVGLVGDWVSLSVRCRVDDALRTNQQAPEVKMVPHPNPHPPLNTFNLPQPPSTLSPHQPPQPPQPAHPHPIKVGFGKLPCGN